MSPNPVLYRNNTKLLQTGGEESRMYARSLLVYWIPDKQGNKTGVPIKASNIYSKPTLKTLEEKFRLNETLRKPHKAGLIEKLNKVLGKLQTASSLAQALRKKEITVIQHNNEYGRLCGITFIDENKKAVFNESELGKVYSADVLSEQFIPEVYLAMGALVQKDNINSHNTIGRLILFTTFRLFHKVVSHL